MAVRKPSADDVLRLGKSTATVKANTPKKKWKAFVKQTHKAGYTVAGQLSGAPNALKERTSSSLVAEAAKRVNSAYAPAEAQLDSQQRQASALDSKRAADNAAFNAWQAGQMERLSAQARQADQVLADQQGQIYKDAEAANGLIQQAAMQSAAASPGAVSNPADSAALKQVAVSQAYGQAGLTNARNDAVSQAASSARTQAAMGASYVGQAGARDASRVSDSNKANAEIATKRADVASSKAARRADEEGSLKQNEVTKANANREFAAAAEQLGLKRDELVVDQMKDTRDYGLKKQAMKLDARSLDQKARIEEAKVDLGYDKIKSAEGQKAADRALKERMAKQKKDVKGGDPKVSQQKYETVEHVKGEIERLHREKKTKNIRANLLKKGYSNVVIDLAEELRVNNGRLSPRSRAKARAIGILNPEQLWSP